MKTFFDRPARVALLCGALVLVWWSLTVHFNYGGNWTALFCTGDSVRIPPDLRAGTYVFPHTNGYDGQFYRYLAHDPALHLYRAFIDDVRLRQQRILLPALAYLLAAGQQPLIDWMVLALVLAGVAAGVYFTSAFAQRFDWHPLWGCLFLLNPGVLTSIDRLLVDGTLAALSAAFAFAVVTRHKRLLWIVLLLSPLAKETGLLLVFAAFSASLLRREWRNAALTLVAALPGVAWMGYVAHTAPASVAAGIIGRPVYGLFLRLFQWPYSSSSQTITIGMNMLETLAMLAYMTAIALAVKVWLNNKSGAIEIASLLFAALALVLGQPSHILEAFGYARSMAPLFVFLLFRCFSDRLTMGAIVGAAVSGPVSAYFLHQALGILAGVTDGVERFAR